MDNTRSRTGISIFKYNLSIENVLCSEVQTLSR